VRVQSARYPIITPSRTIVSECRWWRLGSGCDAVTASRNVVCQRRWEWLGSACDAVAANRSLGG
jgi:hypothetical protein